MVGRPCCRRDAQRSHGLRVRWVHRYRQRRRRRQANAAEARPSAANPNAAIPAERECRDGRPGTSYERGER